MIEICSQNHQNISLKINFVFKKRLKHIIIIGIKILKIDRYKINKFQKL